MKKHTLLWALFLILASCGQNGGDDKGKTTDKSQVLWALPSPLVSKVEVFSDETLIESFAYTYDDKGRIATLVRTDHLSGNKLLDLHYSYPDESGLKADGRFFPLSTGRFITARIDTEERCIDYYGSWVGAWHYRTGYDANGTATGTETVLDYSAKGGQYSSTGRYAEVYSLSGACISSSVNGSVLSARSEGGTSFASDAQVTTRYNYSDQEDRQNFAVYLFPCEFPVWIAAGLPGCSKLITGISRIYGAVPAPSSTHLEYTLDSQGNIIQATRNDMDGDDTILVRTYKFSYL